MQNMSRATSVWILSSLLAVSLVAADDWPHYRGPDYTGSVPADGLFEGRTFGFAVDWSRQVGSGYSSISVVGNVGVTMDSDGTSDMTSWLHWLCMGQTATSTAAKSAAQGGTKRAAKSPAASTESAARKQT